MLENFFRNIPPVVKNLLIINVLMFLATFALQQNMDIRTELGLYNFKSEHFRPYQIVTYMFMHGDFFHLLFNMFALVMFGSILERIWGAKRFLIFYFVTGIGAVVLYSIVNYIEYMGYVSQLTTSDLNEIREHGREVFMNSQRYRDDIMNNVNASLNTPMVGASGALFGVMTAFGVLFPNTELIMLFFPVPIKAKYFIPLMILLELYLGVMQFSGDNVAHFAHLGGAVIGFILLKIWQKKRNDFY